MSHLTIKLIKDANQKDTVNSISGLKKEIDKTFSGQREYMTIYYTDLSNDDIIELLDQYEGSYSNKVSSGCYGARDGKSYDGITFYAHLSNFSDRFIDCDYDEIVNPWHLIKEHCVDGRITPIDEDAVDALCETLDCKEDNTYNFNGHTSEDAAFLTHFQFKTVSTQEKTVMFVRFHEGGDIRGNYSQWYFCSFEHEEDLYSVIYPSLHIIEFNDLDRINEIKDLIWKDPADKELLVKELKSLIG